MTPTSILINASIATGDRRRPWVTALALDGSALAALGSAAELQKLATPATAILNGGGRTLALPARTSIGSLIHIVVASDGTVEAIVTQDRTRANE